MAYYVTTPIYYVNSAPHVGHAYSSVIADAAARIARLLDEDVKFLTGTDEHGQKVERNALNASKSPQEFVESNSELFRELCTVYNISNDDFIRTTQARHVKCVQYLWRLLESRGQIYLGKYAGWYCVRDEAFYQPQELTNDGLSPTGSSVEWVEEESYFFRLSNWQEELLNFYDKEPDFITPKHMRAEVVNFVKSGLKDLSISRNTFSWGIKVPGKEDHVVYVWLDALVNYISALGYPEGEFSKFWPASVHILGKDILRFHAVYWPAFLLAAGLKPPSKLMVHGWWLKDGQKMSKSIGNTLDPFALAQNFGSDEVRHFLLSEMPFGNDGNITYAALARRTNEIADKVGNLVQRVLVFVARKFNSRVPSSEVDSAHPLLIQSSECLNAIKASMHNVNFQAAIAAILELATSVNRYLDLRAPWKFQESSAETIYIALELVRHIGIYLQPFTPSAANEILNQLCVRERQFSSIKNRLQAGAKIAEPKAIFKKVPVEGDFSTPVESSFQLEAN